mgnify:CR=1 FL=1
MTGHKVMKLWSVLVSAFMAVLASLGFTSAATAATSVAQQTQVRNCAPAPTAERPVPVSPAAARHHRTLPPTMKQRITAEAHGTAPTCRTTLSTATHTTTSDQRTTPATATSDQDGNRQAAHGDGNGDGSSEHTAAPPASATADAPGETVNRPGYEVRVSAPGTPRRVLVIAPYHTTTAQSVLRPAAPAGSAEATSGSVRTAGAVVTAVPR